MAWKVNRHRELLIMLLVSSSSLSLFSLLMAESTIERIPISSASLSTRIFFLCALNFGMVFSALFLLQLSTSSGAINFTIFALPVPQLFGFPFSIESSPKKS